MDEHLSRREESSRKTKRLVGMALFTAIIVVLQVFATFVKFGPFSVTLALIPIVVGAAVYGARAGAYLGGVFGVVVLIMCIVGADPGGAILWSANPFLTALLCIVKGAAAGLCVGLVYHAIPEKKKFLGYPMEEIRPEGLSDKLHRIFRVLNVIPVSLICPIVNTGIFCLGMVLFYKDILTAWAGGTALVYYVIVGLIGVNFLLETVINLVLSPIAVRLIDVGSRMGGRKA